MADKAKTWGQRGGYPAGPKTATQMGPPPKGPGAGNGTRRQTKTSPRRRSK